MTGPQGRLALCIVASILAQLAGSACLAVSPIGQLGTDISLTPDDARQATGEILTHIQATATKLNDTPDPGITPQPADLQVTTQAIPPGEYLVYFDWNVNSLNLLAPGAAPPGIEVATQWAALAPDARGLAYLDDGRSLVVLDMESQQHKWVSLPVECFDLPSWSPSADRIALECEDRIYIYSVQDGSFHNLTSWGVQYVDAFLSPTWSPDGRQVAFVSRGLSSLAASPEDGIYVTEVGCIADPPTCRKQTRGPYLAYSNPSILAWAPDSRGLAAYDSVNNLVVIDTDTGDEFTVSDNMHYVDGMAWSPDGKGLAYSVEGGIYLILLQGGPASLLSEGTGYLLGWIKIDGE